jgi:hypothetical protein
MVYVRVSHHFKSFVSQNSWGHLTCAAAFIFSELQRIKQEPFLCFSGFFRMLPQVRTAIAKSRTVEKEVEFTGADSFPGSRTGELVIVVKDPEVSTNWTGAVNSLIARLVTIADR